MRYQFVSAAILASISSVFAQTAGFDAISVPTSGQVVNVGGVLDITWAPNSVAGTVTIKLLEGASPSTLNYDPVVIATSVNNLDGSYKWTVPASVGSFATYGIAIFLDSDVNTFQWSFPFVINAAASSSSSVVVSTTASSSVVASATTESSTTSSVFSSISGIPGGCNPAHAGSCPSSSTTSSVFSSISGIPGGCNPAHAGSCPSSYFSTVTTATATPAPVPTTAPATNGTWTSPSGSNVTLSSGASATQTGSGVVVATGAATAKVATGSFALLGGVFAAFML
ncbi:hypothetical protein BTUL_0012g00670 [Botrytis tulipae]|uniref:Yeast cell wall synthesis Kre9/Knh1-like N-terminal domain-containing protein n=1 Tax=Botrytis tulipae TaxID=87230 RepID=A0A4Z1F1E9_9HELO|nr:hypothetical protein BTUL_0012g00670 [Botrytis tulipae]